MQSTEAWGVQQWTLAGVWALRPWAGPCLGWGWRGLVLSPCRVHREQRGFLPVLSELLLAPRVLPQMRGACPSSQQGEAPRRAHSEGHSQEPRDAAGAPGLWRLLGVQLMPGETLPSSKHGALLWPSREMECPLGIRRPVAALEPAPAWPCQAGW